MPRPGAKENPRRVKLRSGEELTVSFETRPGNELRAYVWDGDRDVVGSVHVDINPQKGTAGIEWAGMAKGWRGKGLGSAVYAEVNRELKQRYRLPLSSDEDGMRSEDSEHLWQKLLRLGQAKRADNRYVMEGLWRLLEWEVTEASDIGRQKALRLVRGMGPMQLLQKLSPEQTESLTASLGDAYDANLDPGQAVDAFADWVVKEKLPKELGPGIVRFSMRLKSDWGKR